MNSDNENETSTAAEADSPAKSPQPPTQLSLARARKLALSLMWGAYAGFYLCRVNIAAAQKNLAAELGLATHSIGALLSVSKICYSTGQFINGPLADRVSPRRLLVLGLLASGLINLVFAHQTRFAWFMILWALNGYFQAFGWTSVVRLTTNWFPPRLREAASGIIGTSYVLGSGLSWMLAGQLTQYFGWRYAFWIPAWLCFAVAGLLLWQLRDHPPQGPATEALTPPPETPLPSPLALFTTMPLTRRLALLGLMLANCCLLFGYHGLWDWTPHYLSEAVGLSPGAAATRAFLLPLGGTLGGLLLAWLARRFPGRLGLSRTVIYPLIALVGLIVLFPNLTRLAPLALPAGLMLLGALSSPPASVMACAMPADICGPSAAGQAAGIVDASGYAGSALSGWLSGQMVDYWSKSHPRHTAWFYVWCLWGAGILLAAGLIALINRGLRSNPSCAEQTCPVPQPPTSETP